MKTFLRFFSFFSIGFFFSIFSAFAVGPDIDVKIFSPDSDPVTLQPINIRIQFSEPVYGFTAEHVSVTHEKLGIDSQYLNKTLERMSASEYLFRLSFETPPEKESIDGEITFQILAGVTRNANGDNTASNKITINFQPNCDDVSMRETEYCIHLSEQIGQNIVVRGDSGLDLFGNFLTIIYRYVASILGVIVVLVLVAGGVMMIAGGANSEMVNTAKSIILKAIISLILLFLVGLILRTINPAFFAAHECEDGIDNDGDGLVDTKDPGCKAGDEAQANARFPLFAQIMSGPSYELYESRATSTCQDGEDNDGDGLTDQNDPDCLREGLYDRTLDTEKKTAKEDDKSGGCTGGSCSTKEPPEEEKTCDVKKQEALEEAREKEKQAQEKVEKAQTPEEKEAAQKELDEAKKEKEEADKAVPEECKEEEEEEEEEKKTFSLKVDVTVPGAEATDADMYVESLTEKVTIGADEKSIDSWVEQKITEMTDYSAASDDGKIEAKELSPAGDKTASAIANEIKDYIVNDLKISADLLDKDPEFEIVLQKYTEKKADGDADGVPDDQDKCLETAEGESVFSHEGRFSSYYKQYGCSCADLLKNREQGGSEESWMCHGKEVLCEEEKGAPVCKEYPTFDVEIHTDSRKERERIFKTIFTDEYVKTGDRILPNSRIKISPRKGYDEAIAFRGYNLPLDKSKAKTGEGHIEEDVSPIMQSLAHSLGVSLEIDGNTFVFLSED